MTLAEPLECLAEALLGPAMFLVCFFASLLEQYCGHKDCPRLRYIQHVMHVITVQTKNGRLPKDTDWPWFADAYLRCLSQMLISDAYLRCLSQMLI